jgi:CheY-like chemotaxis protein
LLKEFGFVTQAFAAAEEFLTSNYLHETKCLILDVAMPDLSGPDLQMELIRRQHEIPIVFIKRTLMAPTNDPSSTISQGEGANLKPAILSIEAAEARFHFTWFSGSQRGSPARE